MRSKKLTLSALLAITALSAFLSGCGSMPAQNSVVTVQIWEVFGRADKPIRLKPAELAQLRAAGVSDGDIAAGRAVGVHCAVMTDGWWEGIAILPSGLKAAEGTTLRVRVLESGNTERLALSEFVELPAQVPRGGLANRMIPNWRELGLRNNYERVEPPAGLRDRYLVVQGSYLLKCTP